MTSSDFPCKHSNLTEHKKTPNPGFGCPLIKLPLKIMKTNGIDCIEGTMYLKENNVHGKELPKEFQVTSTI